MFSQNVSMLVKGLRLAVELMTGMNESISFFERVKSTYLGSHRTESRGQDVQSGGSGSGLPSDVSPLQSGRNESQEPDLPDDVSHLQSGNSGSQEQGRRDDALLRLRRGIRDLSDTIPVMHNLIDLAEWSRHTHCVAKLLPKLKDAVHNAEDLLDEYRWYNKKAELEGNASTSPSTGFIDAPIRGSFEELEDVRGRLENLSRQLKDMGLYNVVKQFDKSVRPETTVLTNEEIIGRDKELKQVMGLLGISDAKRKRNKILVNASTSTSSSTQSRNESRKPPISTLPIVGIGGVGKTTLGQLICNKPQVKSHFDLIIWICVSDDFDPKRLFKEIIQSCPRKGRATTNGNEESTNTLGSLQDALSKHVENKKLLIVLDDIWDDALKDNGECWNSFCAPFICAKEGSMMLVTTRCSNVAEGVGTMKPIMLEGFEDDVMWDFFKLCIFGSECSGMDPELEDIGRRILPKLKGSPLAAKTLGRMLKRDLQASHWKHILESELWKLPQKANEILPALRLSYMYLPFCLKQCFSFCAVYPKDYKFEKKHLAEIWVAEGFVEHHDNDSLTKIGCQYFEDLVTRSFFQQVRGGRYVIHDLLHDMAQQVSEHDCCILRSETDFLNVPENVRHIYIHPNNTISSSHLLSLCKYTKLRTIICKKQLRNRKSLVMEKWCSNLLVLRVISLSTTNELPDSIGHLKHLRYIKISEHCPLSIPSTFHWLYNLQILDVTKCKIESLPNDFGNLSELQRFSSEGFTYCPHDYIFHDVASNGVQGVLIKNLNQFRGSLTISNVGMLSMDHAAEAQLKSKKYMYGLELNWWSSSFRFPSSSPFSFRNSQEPQVMQHNAAEVLHLLQPPISVRSLKVMGYPGVSLPSWFQGQNLPCLTSLTYECCDGLDSISCSMVSQSININEIPPVLDDNNIGSFMSLTEVNIVRCKNLSSLNHFLHPDYVPAIKKIELIGCESLVSVGTERFGELGLLEEFKVRGCPNIFSETLVSPSLKLLELGDNLCDSIECCSLTVSISSNSAMSIQRQTWSFPALQQLTFKDCRYLISIGVSTNPPLCEGNGTKLNFLNIHYCPELSTIEFDGHLTQEYPPTVERIDISGCPKLLSVQGFGSLPSLKQLRVSGCEGLNWDRGFVLPSSLQTLDLFRIGDYSACVPGCLENLTSLVSLKISRCEGMMSIPGSIWTNNLALLQDLEILDCPNLFSIGGEEAVAKIKNVEIFGCSNLKEAEPIMRRRPRASWCQGR